MMDMTWKEILVTLAVGTALLVGLLFMIVAKQKYIKEHNCQVTGQTRLQWIVTLQTYNGGKTYVPVTTYYYETEFACDNGKQWM